MPLGVKVQVMVPAPSYAMVMGVVPPPKLRPPVLLGALMPFRR